MSSRPDPAAAVTGPTGPAAPEVVAPEVVAPEVVALDHGFDADGLYAMRAAVAAHASRLGVGGERLEHLLIVASELANNAIRHGDGSGRLRLWRSGDRIHCEVSDRGPGIADPGTGSSPPDPGQVGGRGLWICRQLSDRLEIVGGVAGGTVVTAAVPVQPTGGGGTP